MIRCSNRGGCSCTKSVDGLTPGDVPAAENNPVNERVVESSTHEVAQQTPRNVSNLEQSIDKLAEIVTTMVHNQTHLYAGHVYTIERVQNLGAKSFNGSGDAPEAESWFVKLERIFNMMSCSEEDGLSFATFLLEDKAYHWWQIVEHQYQ